MPQKNSKILERIYRLFSLRQRSEKEIWDYFKIKNQRAKITGKEPYSDFIIETTIQKLKELRLLDDGQFAKAWVESRSKKKGLRVIKLELIQKGVSEEIIEEVISNKRQDTNEKETVARLLEKKINSWKNLEPLKLKKKAYEFLMRRGFEYEVVKEVIDTSIKLSVNPELKSKD